MSNLPLVSRKIPFLQVVNISWWIRHETIYLLSTRRGPGKSLADFPREMLITKFTMADNYLRWLQKSDVSVYSIIRVLRIVEPGFSRNTAKTIFEKIDTWMFLSCDDFRCTNTKKIHILFLLVCLVGWKCDMMFQRKSFSNVSTPSTHAGQAWKDLTEGVGKETGRVQGWGGGRAG